jgi:hypothetical protein
MVQKDGIYRIKIMLILRPEDYPLRGSKHVALNVQVNYIVTYIELCLMDLPFPN